MHADTRSLRAGDLFVALKGERFDAASFLPEAAAQGRWRCCATKGRRPSWRPPVCRGAGADVRLALGELAVPVAPPFRQPAHRRHRQQQQDHGDADDRLDPARLARRRALATEGNLNNDIGVPLTLLRLRSHSTGWRWWNWAHEPPGRDCWLAAIAAPVALVNNAQREHQGSWPGVEAVAAKTAPVLTGAAGRGVAVFPAADSLQSSGGLLAGRPSCARL